MFTKILTSSLLFLIAIGGFFVSVDVGVQNSGQFAVELSFSETFAEDVKTSESETLKKWIDIFNAALWVLTVIVSPAVIFAGWLMSPDWTSGDIFWLREPMHKIWVIVSNIVYFVYAILLIIIAVATVLGKDNFNYKVMLPKLALGILMVPFTWWFVQWTISLSTIVTASTISIPMEMIREDNRYINGNYVPRYYLTTNDPDSKNATTQYAQNCDWTTVWRWNADCTSIQEIIENGWWIYSTMLVYAYQVFRLQDYKSIDSTLNQIKTAWQLLNNVIIWAVMFLVFGILVIALIMVLFVRAIKLWMYAMFSPLFTLHFVAGKELFKDSDSFSLKEFVWLCFMPAIVGITLSFGLMVISVIQAPGQASWQESCTATQFTITVPWNTIENIRNATGWCRLIGQMWIFKRWIWTKWPQDEWAVNIIEAAGIKYVYTWKATNASDMRQSINNISGWLSAAGGIFWTIVIDIIALVFIWMAFMAAKWVNKTISKVLDPFEQMGKKVWDMAMSAPKYAPLPIPGGSISGLNRTVELWKQAIDTHHRKKEEEAIGKFAPGLLQWTIKAEANARYQDAMWSDKGNFQKTREHVANVTSGATSEREKNWDDLANWFSKISSVIREDWKKLGINLSKEQKEAYDKLIAWDVSGVKSLSANDKDVVWKILASWTAANATKDNKQQANQFTATQQWASTSNSFTINLWNNIKLDANIQDNKFSWDAISTDEWKKKLEEFMKNTTENEFKSQRPDNIPSKTWDELIKKMKEEWRKFKSE